MKGRQWRRIPEETEQWIRRLYEEGSTYEEVATLVGHHVATVQRALRRAGGTPRPRGGRALDRNGNWKGGSNIMNGYYRVLVSDDHQFAAQRDSARRIAKHRLVMMEHLGRPLESHETVHHINGDKLDNTIENLQLLVGNHGPGRMLVCKRCGSQDLIAKELQHA